MAFLDWWTDPDGVAHEPAGINHNCLYRFGPEDFVGASYYSSARSEQAIVVFMDTDTEASERMAPQLGTYNRYKQLILRNNKKHVGVVFAGWHREGTKHDAAVPWSGSNKLTMEPPEKNGITVYQWEDGADNDYNDSMLSIYKPHLIWVIRRGRYGEGPGSQYLLFGAKEMADSIAWQCTQPLAGGGKPFFDYAEVLSFGQAGGFGSWEEPVAIV